MSARHKLNIVLLRCLVRTVGRLSDGIRISFDSGFTSGRMLDYVYRNKPSGRYLIGQIVDYIYLSHTGWEVVRRRKLNLEVLLREAISKQRELARKPVLLDVASGPSQYVLDVLREEGMDDVVAICRDLDQDALELGKRNAARLGLESVRFEHGNALEATSLAQVEPKCNIAVSSGFYDWIPDDTLVQHSMRLIYDVLPDCGCFLFTNQSGHVDLEMANSIFVDSRNQPLQMVVRPSETVNDWAATTGFQILETASDQLGHYSVTLAQKRMPPRDAV